MSTATKQMRDRLKEVHAEIEGLRDERADAKREVEAAQQAFAENFKPGSKEHLAAKAAVEKRGKIDDAIADKEAAQVALLEMISGISGNGSTSPITADGGSASRSWSSAELMANDETRARLHEMSSTSASVGRVNLGHLADRDTYAADITGTANMRRGEYIGVLPQLRRRLRILDLIPIGTMDQNTVPYTQESGSFSSAVETAEGLRKPEAAVAFTDQTATAATIAHWTKTRKQVLADFPALQAILDGRLRYGVERRLSDQIVVGDGAGENIRGILNTSGIGSVAFSASELVADQILEGLTTVLLSDAEADAIIMHPTDWKAALKVKAVGDGHYYSNGPFSVTPQVLWGVPLIPSAGVPQGTALVGDFAAGAQLFIREGVFLLISDADGLDFTENRVTILAEMRAALAVWRPAAFATVRLVA